MIFIFHLRKTLLLQGIFPILEMEVHSWITLWVVQSNHRLGLEGKIQAGIQYCLKEPYVEWDTLWDQRFTPGVIPIQGNKFCCVRVNQLEAEFSFPEVQAKLGPDVIGDHLLGHVNIKV